MPKSVIIPAGSSAPLAPFVPGTLADGVVYVSGTLAFHEGFLFLSDAYLKLSKVAVLKSTVGWRCLYIHTMLIPQISASRFFPPPPGGQLTLSERRGLG